MTLEEVGDPLRYVAVKRAVHAWIKYYDSPAKRGNFYIHTDTDAMAFVESRSGVTDLDVTLPPTDKQDAVLEALLEPQGIGCPHLRAIMENPDMYNVREDLVKMFVTHIFRTLWDPTEPLRKRMRVYIYHAPEIGGLPNEAAWVNFKVGDVCKKEGLQPVFPPWSDGVSVLVNHPQAVDRLHNETALFIKGLTGGTASSLDLVPKLKAKYVAWDGITKGLLAATQGLPVFDVEISSVPLPAASDAAAAADSAANKDEDGKTAAGVDPLMYQVAPLPAEGIA